MFSNIYLYSYFTDIISEKSHSLETNNISYIASNLESPLELLASLGTLCANDADVARVMRYQHLGTLERKQAALKAQDILTAYMKSYHISNYITRLVAFNEYGINIQTVARTNSKQSDPADIMKLPVFQKMQDQVAKGARQVIGLSHALERDADCFAFLAPVYNNASMSYMGWVYIEINLDWIDEALVPFTGGEYYLIAGDKTFGQKDGQLWLTNIDVGGYADGDVFQEDNTIYKIYLRELFVTPNSTVMLENISVLRRADVTFTESSGTPVVYTVLVVLFTALLIALILAVLLSSIITKPLSLLTARLRRISNNDFSFDPEIEKGHDEIAEMGSVINEMTVSIEMLLANQERMHLERQNAEIALLQSQVKPHFLYNTLDSIRWMATIQNNPGIVSMTRNLSNLLRNLSKGVGDIITLREELALLEAYVGIQSIRYVETFSYSTLVNDDLLSCRIIKFTLQPLVENAIFHGIVPAGSYGTVTVDAYEETGDTHDLVITVTDNGTGMTEEEIKELFTEGGNDLPASLSGIGVINVHQRLRLQYGAPYGLSYESVLGEYTRAIVRIPFEKEDFAIGEKPSADR